jgi:DNA-binding YbaB/EbfC family protein
MFGNMKDLGSLMKQAGQFREKAEQLKQELERKTVTGEAGGGAVRVTMNGRGRVVHMEIDQNMLSGLAGDDKEMVEELITLAVNNAMDKVQELIASEVRELTGGMNIPGLNEMFGGESSSGGDTSSGPPSSTGGP